MPCKDKSLQLSSPALCHDLLLKQAGHPWASFKLQFQIIILCHILHVAAFHDRMDKVGYAQGFYKHTVTCCGEQTRRIGSPMLICELRTQRRLARSSQTYWNPRCILCKRVGRPRCVQVHAKTTATKRDERQLAQILSKYQGKESEEILRWLNQSPGAPVFLECNAKNVRLTDIVDKLKASDDLDTIWKNSPSEQNGKHFLVSLVHKVYSKVLRKERRKFSVAFDEEAAKVEHALFFE